MDRKETEKFISSTYNATAEYPWLKYPDYEVFRHSENNKWFALIMDVPKSVFGCGEGVFDILNVKCDPVMIGAFLSETGFFPAYHMSKSNWISVALDGSVDDEKIKMLIDISFRLTAPKTKSKKA